MGHESHPEFVTLHALRIKGFAPVPTIAGLAALPEAEVHLERLADDVGAARAIERLTELYEPFLQHNDEFKQLCTDWQLRDGAPNDHTDADYDREVIDRLDALHGSASPVVASLAAILRRLGPYAPRLDQVLRRVVDGETNMFTGVMCGSYHDVWMELHEDLILTQGIDRSAEGSF